MRTSRRCIVGSIVMIFLLFGLSLLRSFSAVSVLEDDHSAQEAEVYPLSEWHMKVRDWTNQLKINWSCQHDAQYPVWQLTAEWLNHRHITNDHASNQLGCVLKAMQRSAITHADVGLKGTQLKATLTLGDAQRVVFKPRFYERDFTMVGTPYAGKDRHNAEIAAFHVNRVIGLHKVPLVVGRVVDLESEVRPVAHRNLLSTFFYKDGNACFYGKCHYCKGPETGVCANRTLLEGSLTIWLPDAYKLGNTQRHPWSRTYNSHRQAAWETKSDYCHTVRRTRPYETPPRLLDLVDIAVFDFIISNADRHHYETFEYSKDSSVIALDNGKSFGNPYVDEMTILAPLYQCCIIRQRMYDRLWQLRNGVLGQVLYNILREESLAPILSRSNYKAVDRRLHIVLNIVDECISKHGRQEVLLDDSYT